jgi:hypothetical protein
MIAAIVRDERQGRLNRDPPKVVDLGSTRGSTSKWI